ncbi:hypothetical protein P872_20205 [Rhodonellum psychrophilum GCM71 = DSM 17998]|uniref:Gp5/Type VI secretion system Vgr protein OB-fold domain-containing protein n=2 Tax=Rhodonellum TaxID=336827 RepID=U5BX64_9BACT|nr:MULTISPECIES: type VI secretion system tip protein VgrG [Rhodonellum]ERM81211.1 hypothetical protein P872_20205 [Rhodonellum psychrophilum GCM71 = DSM 17998]SDZ52389.1 Rhs element Vgr protein [Rhodonellum ikkaensis]
MATLIQENPLPISFSIAINGSPINDSIEVVSIRISQEINRIATANIRILDGGAFGVGNEDFDNSNGPDFIPGNQIDISLGYGDDRNKVYSGIVLSQKMVVKRNNSFIEVECRDKAFKLTKGRFNGIYVDSKDSDVFKKILNDNGLANEVAPTDQMYGQLVQHSSSYWDYILIRAEVNNMFVLTENNTLKIKLFDLSVSPDFKIGADTLALDVDLELSAENIHKNFTTVSWDEDSQAINESTASLSDSLNLGNLSAVKLSGVNEEVVISRASAASLEKTELENFAKSAVSRSVLSKIKGRIQIPGTAEIKAGDLLELSGFGDRFSGNAFVSKVNHDLEEGNWITSIFIGLSSRWHSSLPEVEEHEASGLLPAAKGMYIGIVKAIHEDPDDNFRVKISLPSLKSETPDTFLWARISFNYASANCGMFFFPEIDDEVLVSFVNNDPRFPVVVGGLYSKKNSPKEVPDEKNQFKSIITKSGISIRFDDEEKILTISTPGGNTFVLDDKNKQILVQDLNNNKLTMNDKGISLDSPKDIVLSAKGKITLDAMDEIGISSKADLKSKALNIAMEAQVGFKAAGNASAEISASGQTTVKGAMVMIN